MFVYMYKCNVGVVLYACMNECDVRIVSYSRNQLHKKMIIVFLELESWPHQCYMYLQRQPDTVLMRCPIKALTGRQRCRLMGRPARERLGQGRGKIDVAFTPPPRNVRGFLARDRHINNIARSPMALLCVMISSDSRRPFPLPRLNSHLTFPLHYPPSQPPHFSSPFVCHHNLHFILTPHPRPGSFSMTHHTVSPVFHPPHPLAPISPFTSTFQILSKRIVMQIVSYYQGTRAYFRGGFIG